MVPPVCFASLCATIRPDAPTMAESGFPGFEQTAPWVGLLAPAGTPKEAVDKLQASANRLVLALVASALILGSAVIAVFARSTDVAGLALIAIPGAILSLAIVVWLCVGIFRSGRW